MTKSIFIAAALVAAATFTTDASAATRHAASRHAQATTTTESVAGDCVRAPDVGAFATAPYAVPPCLPGTAN